MLSILMFFLAPHVVSLLFGAGYEQSVEVLQIMSVLPIIIGLSHVFGVLVLLSHGYKKEFSSVLLLSGFFSLFTLIPLCYYFGAIGAAVSVGLSYVTILSAAKEKMMRWSLFFLSLISGYYAFGPAGMIAGGLWGWFYGWFVFWLFEGRYRARLHSYLTSGQVLWHFTFRLICGAVFAYLIMPIIVVMPLSFNAQNYFTFTPEMLQFDPAGYSLKHYMDFFYNNEWQRSFKNSLIIAPIATVISVTLGTLAAIGLSQSHVPFKRLITALLISPMIVPLIISATGMFFFYATVGNFLENSLGIDKNLVGYVKVILAHSVLGIPFVIITVTATLVGFDNSLTRASANMGAGPVKTFFKVQMPLTSITQARKAGFSGKRA